MEKWILRCLSLLAVFLAGPAPLARGSEKNSRLCDDAARSFTRALLGKPFSAKRVPHKLSTLGSVPIYEFSPQAPSLGSPSQSPTLLITAKASGLAMIPTPGGGTVTLTAGESAFVWDYPAAPDGSRREYALIRNASCQSIRLSASDYRKDGYALHASLVYDVPEDCAAFAAKLGGNPQTFLSDFNFLREWMSERCGLRGASSGESAPAGTPESTPSADNRLDE